MGKKHIMGLAMVFCLFFGALVWVQAEDDISLHGACSNCGMDRGKFASTRMVVEFSDGKVAAVCSIRCAADTLAQNPGKTTKSISVADMNGKQLIDAEKAFWIVGGKMSGVMSKTGKWAFLKKEDAETFMKSNGGNLVTFKEAMNAAREELSGGMKMMGGHGKMQEMKPMAGGGCKCKGAPSENKCPTCGMLTAKFVDSNATIEFKDGTQATFDGTKCMFKYYLDIKKYNPSKSTEDIKAIYVKDYYTKAKTDGKAAFYVIWSDQYGPMGHEPIPFEKEQDAKRFMKEHKGKSIIGFNDVNAKLITSLDNPP